MVFEEFQFELVLEGGLIKIWPFTTLPGTLLISVSVETLMALTSQNSGGPWREGAIRFWWDLILITARRNHVSMVLSLWPPWYPCRSHLRIRTSSAAVTFLVNMFRDFVFFEDQWTHGFLHISHICIDLTLSLLLLQVFKVRVENMMVKELLTRLLLFEPLVI